MLSLGILLWVIPCVAYSQYCNSWNSKYGYALDIPAYKTLIAEDLGDCVQSCFDDKLCHSFNFNLINKRCEQSVWTTKRSPSKLVKRENSIYMNIRDSEDLGKTKLQAVRSCKKLKHLYPKAPSGVYWVDLTGDGSSDLSFQVYCDMDTDGGGWTLVYSYRFTNFANFKDGSNAISPTPSWPVSWSSNGWTPRSTTIPLSESSYSAMDFALWKRIGNEFLVKSNITHWIACNSQTGDLVNWKGGTLACRVVKNVANTCLNNAPDFLRLVNNNNCGIALLKSSAYYFFLEGKTSGCWPVHDPCGKTSPNNHLKSNPNPGGAIYVR